MLYFIYVTGHSLPIVQIALLCGQGCVTVELHICLALCHDRRQHQQRGRASYKQPYPAIHVKSPD